MQILKILLQQANEDYIEKAVFYANNINELENIRKNFLIK